MHFGSREKTTMFETAVYTLCVIASATCSLLLFRAYRRQPMRLLLTSAICFGFLALNNLFVVIDLVVLPEVDLLPFRYAAALIALAVLLFGFIWEME